MLALLLAAITIGSGDVSVSAIQVRKSMWQLEVSLAIAALVVFEYDALSRVGGCSSGPALPRPH
jgi:hypothetical protein